MGKDRVGEPASVCGSPVAHVQSALYGASGGLPIAVRVLCLGYGQVRPQQVPGPADVHPDSVHFVSLDPATLGHQPRDQVLGEIVERVLRHLRQDVLLQDVHPGVDQVGEDLLGLRLLLELRYPELVVDPGDPELAGILDGGERYRHGRSRLLVPPDLAGDIHRHEHIAVGRDERVVQTVLDKLHRPSGAQRLVLVRVFDAQTQIGTVAYGAPHELGLVPAGQDDLLYPAGGQRPE